MEEAILLLRQVHPSWIQGDSFSQQVFTSQTFTPTSKDEGLLSVYNGDMFTPETAYNNHISQSLKSAGVVAVSKKECNEEDVPVIEDNDPFEGHCSLDFTSKSKGQVNRTAAAFKRYAQNRGWLFQNTSL